MSCLALLHKAQGQDLSNPTFSQYHYTPFFTNPGMVAMSEDIQLMFNYRRKQIDAGQSFDTPMFSFLYPLTSKATGKHFGSTGISVISDNAADFLKTNGVMLAYAHKISFGSSYLNIGLQGGYFQKRIDLAGLTTANQFTGTGFDPSQGSGEMMDGATKSYATFGGGLFWGMNDEMGRQKAFLGLSYLNFTQPNVAFLDNGNDANLPASIVATGGIRVLQTDRFSIMPNARFVNTAGNSQVNAGSWFNYHFLGATDGFLREGTLGLGAWYNTTNALIMSLEFNQPNYLIAASYDIPTSSDISNIQRNGVFELTVALKLRKGKEKAPQQEDRDGDGVPDDVDACPDTPGMKEMMGCPDSDGDGIPDSYDNCPNEAGSRDLGGCPDTDGDGIADKDDKCPNEAGPKSNEGCPEKKEVELTPRELQILEIAKYVHFESGTAIIENTSFSNLDLVAEVMKEHPNDVLSLDGHTDNVGDAEANLELGRQRAESVKAYLIAKGVPADNITTMSSGEEKPIADNNTEEGKALNRRVEMKIIKKR